VTELKPWVRGVVTVYICTIVPVLVLATVMMALHAPRAFATAYDSFGVQWDRVVGASGLVAGAAGVVQLATLVLPCLGMVLTSGRLGRRMCGSAWRWADGEPVRRGVLGVGGVAVAGLAAFIWWPNGEYRPIQPTERGTVQAAVGSMAAVPTGRPALTPQRERELGGAPTERERRRAEREATGTQAPDDKTKGVPSEQTSTTGTTDTTPTDTTPTDTTPADTTSTGTTPSGTLPTDTTPAGTAPAGTPAPTDTTAPSAGTTTVLPDGTTTTTGTPPPGTTTVLPDGTTTTMTTPAPPAP
jgi:putative peptide zinc metalloprotease protein